MLGLLAKMLNTDILVRDFEFHLRSNVHLRTNAADKGVNLLIPPAVGEIEPHLFPYNERLGTK